MVGKICVNCAADKTTEKEFELRVPYPRRCVCGKLCGPVGEMTVLEDDRVLANYWCRKCDTVWICHDRVISDDVESDAPCGCCLDDDDCSSCSSDEDCESDDDDRGSQENDNQEV